MVMIALTTRVTVGIEVDRGLLVGALAAAGYYDTVRGRGKTHQQALRQIANRWVGILHGCLTHRKELAWPKADGTRACHPPARGMSSSEW